MEFDRIREQLITIAMQINEEVFTQSFQFTRTSLPDDF